MEEKSKIEYLAKMLSDRTVGKRYENFIINAIYTKLDNSELKPVTQQFVHNPNENVNHKHYFLDLFFPQINYGIEIDEGHHHEINQKNKDKIRAENIFVATNVEEGRISVFDDNMKVRSYEDICSQIEREVTKINKRISQLKTPLKWLSREDEIRKILTNGVIDINMDFDFGGITEILNMLGSKNKKGNEYEIYRHAFKRDFTEKYSLWVPHWSKEDANGDWLPNNGWVNYPNEDKTEIFEIDIGDKRTPEKSGAANENGKKRIVFMHMKNRFGENCTRFIGVFELDRISRKNGNCIRHYERSSTKLNIKRM